MPANLLLVLQIIQLAEGVTPGIIAALKDAFAQGKTIDELIAQAAAANAQTEATADAEIKADTPPIL